jgi:hypothetical protein
MTHARRNSRNRPDSRRDATMILLAYRHGIRCSELVGAGGLAITSAAPMSVEGHMSYFRFFFGFGFASGSSA